MSPENAREALMAFVKGAKRQLLIYDVNIQDPVFMKLLAQQAAAGIEVRVIGKCKGCKGIDVRPLRSMRLQSEPSPDLTGQAARGRRVHHQRRRGAPDSEHLRG